MVEDRELIAQMDRGDRNALRLIYDKYKDDLLRIGSCMIGNRTDAEDCLHDIFVSLAAKSARIRPDGNLKGYLITAMANRSRDRLRKMQRSNQVHDRYGKANCQSVTDALDPAGAMAADEANDRLYRAIGDLPAEQRTVITLRLHGDWTFDEIAQLENVSSNTIRSRYRYGLDKLRASLGAGVQL